MKHVVPPMLVALVVLVGLTGCAHPTGAPAASSGSATSGAASSDPLPRRPREIRMDGLDPCRLASPEVLAQAGVPDHPEEAPAKVPGVRDCGWARTILQKPSGELSVAVTTDQDVRNVLTVEGSEVTTVAGFGAVEIPNGLGGAESTCDVRVDVAPGQGLWVSYYNTLGDEPGATHELMCRRAHTAAETIMRDLLARTG